MRLEVLPDAQAAASRAAARIAEAAREAIAARGQFAFAVSGGHSPWVMLRALAGESLPWESIHVFQVDERVAPAGDPDRNLTHLRESLLSRAPLPEDHVHAMPVEARRPRDRRGEVRARVSSGSPARRRFSTSSTWASAPTGTPRRSCPATRRSPSPTATWR